MNVKQNLIIADTGFVFDPDTGDSFSVNNSARELLEKMKEGRNTEEITSYITEKYDVDSLRFQRYLEDFIQALRHYNIMEEDE